MSVAIDSELGRCAVGGSRTRPSCERSLHSTNSPAARATVLGRGDKLDIMLAALMTASHRTRSTSTTRTCARSSHPTGRLLSAILGSPTTTVTGEEFLHAFILAWKSNAASAMQFILRTMTSAGTSPERLACLALPLRREDFGAG